MNLYTKQTTLLKPNKQYLANLIAIISFFAFIGCGSQINLKDYDPHILQKAPNMSSKLTMLDERGVDIVITNTNTAKLKKAKQANLDNSMRVSLKQIFANDKSTNILERMGKNGYQQILKQEVQLAEAAKESGDYIGQAQFIIKSTLNKATFSNTYKEGYSYYTTRNKKKVKINVPPERTYQACIGGVVEVFTLPELSMDKSVSFDKCVRNTVRNANRYDYKKRDDGMMGEAGAAAIKQASYGLRNFFSKKGYIYEAKIKDDDVIVKTSLGQDFGAKEGEDVEIFTIEKETNALTGKTNKVHIKIGAGTVSNKLSRHYSWIVVDEIEEGKTLHLGDYIKIKYEAGFWD